MAQVSFVVSILSSFPLSCLSWMSPTLLKRPATVQTRRPMMSVSSSLPGVFFGPEEEFECPDEEECEIDWDKMPGYDGEDEGAASNEELLPGKSTNLYTNFVDEEDADALDDLQPKSYEHEVQNSVEKSRVLFEVNWQVDECNVDHDRCSDFCSECAGSGRCFCKFCRGTRTITFGNEFRTCLICDADGRIKCPACRGTGSVAPWVATQQQ